MKQLRQYIKQILLTEAAKTPRDLPDDWLVETRFYPGEGLIVILWHIRPGKIPERLGEVQAETRSWRQGDRCSGAYEVHWADAEKASGFGPMLYDVAMELVGDAGLMCDRRSVSNEAQRVWEYYLNNRPDVIAKQLDDREEPFLQDPNQNDPSDDCVQWTFRHKTRTKGDTAKNSPGFKQKFLDHWSTKAYVKTTGTPIIDELGALGKIRDDS